MVQIKPIRIPDNTKISRISKIGMNSNLSLLNNVKSFSHSFLLYLICFLVICNIASFGVSAQQTDSDKTIAIPSMQWSDLQHRLTGTPPPGLKDFAFGYSKENNLVIIFGGTTPSGGKSSATYLIDLNEFAWKNPPDNGLHPEARSNMIFGVDKSSSYRNAFIISCGQGSGNVLYNDVWAFDFIYKQWTKVNVSGEAPPMYGSFGGIDTTLATSSQTVENNTLWASHGTNGTHFFTDLYALVTNGTLTPNLATISATWYKVNVNGEVPSGRSSVAGTILPNGRLAMYGGCDKPDGNCATSDAYSLNLGSKYLNGQIDSAEPLWSKKNSCLGARLGAAMVMNSNPGVSYLNQAIVYGGSSPEGKSVGVPGEIGVLDADLGNWVRVLPQKDPMYGYPPQRAGAQMIPIPIAIGDAGYPGTDILLFGGEGLENNANLNDIWILRLNNSATSGVSTQTTTMEFLKCVQATSTQSGSKSTETKGGTTGNGQGNVSGGGGSDDFQLNHVASSTISFACLPLAASVIRFGFGSNHKFVIAGLYTTLIVTSYATVFYGFAIAFQAKSSGHFTTRHGLFGLLLLGLLYIFVPLMAIVSLCASKKYESDSIISDDPGSDKGGIGSKLTRFFNWKNSESNSKPVKSFEVSRPGNRLAEVSSQSPPMSIIKSSDNWMEQRKSVTIAENHPTMSSQGSRNNSLQNVPNSRRTSQSTAVSRGGLQTLTTTSNIIINHPTPSVVIIIRHIHHIIAQIGLFLTAIYIGIASKDVNPFYFYGFIGFMIIIYLIWIIAAWYGFPKGRNSLLVLFMHQIACGKGEIKQSDFGENCESSEGGAIPPPSSNRVRNVRIEDDEMDEEAEQAQLEQDMHNREVVVMTIPKRRLTVVNA